MRSDLKFETSNLKFRLCGLKFQISNFNFQIISWVALPLELETRALRNGALLRGRLHPSPGKSGPIWGPPAPRRLPKAAGQPAGERISRLYLRRRDSRGLPGHSLPFAVTLEERARVTEIVGHSTVVLD